MSSITDKLYDLTNTVPFKQASIACYLASGQLGLLTNLDGTAVSPVGSPVTTTVTSDLGEYSLTGLTAGVLYDLYVEPTDGAPFWIIDRVPDVEVSATPCVLYGSVDVGVDLVWAFLEYPAVVSGGVRINDGSVFSTVSSQGAFSLSLWPTSSLVPASLYRVHVGNSIYRGLIPGQTSINFSDWLALSTTIQLV